MWNLPGTAEPTPKTEIDGRLAGLRTGMAAVGVDFALIMQTVDLFYFTGSAQKAILVVPVDEDPLYFVQRSLTRAREESPLAVIEIATDKAIAGLVEKKEVFKGKGGMELDVVPVSLFERMKGILGIADVTDISSIIKGLRLIKSPHEIEQVRRSGALCDFMFERARRVIKEGVREIDIDAELNAEGRRRGHQGFLRMRGFNQEMMNLYVTAGFTGAVPSAGDVPISGFGLSPAVAQGSSVKTVERGIPVIVDCGGGYAGYITDETRSFVVGELDEMFRRPFDISLAIVEDVLSYGKEGVDCTDVFDRAWARVKAAGLESYFMGSGEGQVSFIGHGVGLEINELPVITARHHMVLREGMVCAIEPKFVFPGKGVVGIEVDFIVGKNGVERVSKTPMDLIRL